MLAKISLILLDYLFLYPTHFRIILVIPEKINHGRKPAGADIVLQPVKISGKQRKPRTSPGKARYYRKKTPPDSSSLNNYRLVKKYSEHFFSPGIESSQHFFAP